MRYLLVLDFEATCCEKFEFDRKEMEIIEFPTLVYNLSEKRVLGTFHEYVKPVVHPTLTKFCTDLTGITQHVVDKADTFPFVWSRYKEFMRYHGLLNDSAIYSFVICGNYDLKTALPQQLQLSSAHLESADFSILEAHFQNRLMNIKNSFGRFYGVNYKPDLSGMLRVLGMKQEGRPHSGIDDCKNILRIVERMVEDGWNPSDDWPRC